jgi:ribosome maturation factor RimP
MMKRDEIIERMQEPVAQRGCYIVDAQIGKDDDITLTVDKDNGSVSLEDCEAINDAFLAAFDKDQEDYSLTVTSAGLDQPFKVLRQYQKAIGSQVEVRLRNGKKIIGLLSDATKDGITLRYSLREAVEGKKRKVMVEHEEIFRMEDINSVAPYIIFKQKTKKK